MSPRLQRSLVCVVLTALVWLVYGQGLRSEFVNFDDPVYVTDNVRVLRGPPLQGAEWAFTHAVNANYHPLTLLSYLVDYKLYGVNPGGYHLTNIQLHIAAVLLLFLVLDWMTGALWRAAFVAAVFAVHPMHVESVAWVSERKDVLSGVFFMLTLCAYAFYVRRPGVTRYLAVLVFCALGLLSKPMLVTLPFVLLLLDYWPLGRWNLGFKKLALEKVPLVALSAGACAAALQTQRGAMYGVFTASIRICNALVSYVVYMGQSIYPARLAALYPFSPISIAEAAGAVVLLAAISAAAFFWRRSRAYLLTGWLWYVGMLVPVIGFVQVGTQARADRYMYLPQIGLVLAATWLVADLSAFLPRRRAWLGGSAGAAIAVLAFMAHGQTAYWHDSETLWRHTLASTGPNPLARHNFGEALFEEGETDEAIQELEGALRLAPGYAVGHRNLGVAFLQKVMVDAAMAEFKEALALEPDDPETWLDQGNALLQKGGLDAALDAYRKAIALQPDNLKANYNLGDGLLKKGDPKGAVRYYQKALESDPLFVPALNNVAWVLATTTDASLRNGPLAVELAQRANQSSGGQNPDVLRTLAKAYAAARQPQAAAQAARDAQRMATAQGNTALAALLGPEIDGYEKGAAPDGAH